jgi:hypothetical protein
MPDSSITPSLEVNGHKVPAIAYKRIVELWRRGWTEAEISREAMNTMCNKNFGAISEVVLGAINDQKFSFTLASETDRKNYLDIPIDSTDAIRKAELALQEIRAALARAESIEDELALEAIKLMESRPKLIGDAKTHLERMDRQANIDKTTRGALKRRQQAEEDVAHLKEVEKIRQRLLALSIC